MGKASPHLQPPWGTQQGGVKGAQSEPSQGCGGIWNPSAPHWDPPSRYCGSVQPDTAWGHAGHGATVEMRLGQPTGDSGTMELRVTWHSSPSPWVVSLSR